MFVNISRCGVIVFLLAGIISIGKVDSLGCLPGSVAMWISGVRTNICYPHSVCPRALCLVNPCQAQRNCLTRPGSKCIPNYCGGCFALFFYVHPNTDGHICPL